MIKLFKERSLSFKTSQSDRGSISRRCLRNESEHSRHSVKRDEKILIAFKVHPKFKVDIIGIVIF